MNLQDLAQGIGDERLPTFTTPIRDSIDTARGYRMIDEVWSCVPDSLYPWDGAILKAIQKFAPDTVPLWRMSVFYAPNTRNIVVFGRHALGRHIEFAGYELSGFHALMPTMPCLGVTFKRPNKIWFVHEGNRNPDYPDIPGQYLPFDDSILHKARWSVGDLPNMSDREAKQFLHKELVEDVLEARAKRKAQVEDDFEQRRKDVAPYLRKLIDSISDVEIDEYQRSLGKRPRATKATVVLKGTTPEETR